MSDSTPNFRSQDGRVEACVCVCVCVTPATAFKCHCHVCVLYRLQRMRDRHRQSALGHRGRTTFDTHSHLPTTNTKGNGFNNQKRQPKKARPATGNNEEQPPPLLPFATPAPHGDYSNNNVSHPSALRGTPATGHDVHSHPQRGWTGAMSSVLLNVVYIARCTQVNTRPTARRTVGRQKGGIAHRHTNTVAFVVRRVLGEPGHATSEAPRISATP